jgi:hypothetical protein
MIQPPDIQALQDLQARLAWMSHAYRQSDKFEVSQYLSDAGESIGKAVREIELSQQRVAANGRES